MPPPMSRVHADHCSCTPDASDVRAQSFVAHSQWGMLELEWLNEHGEPRNHVFEQFFVYLDTYPGMTTSVYDKALKWAQNMLNRKLITAGKNVSPNYVRSIPLCAANWKKWSDLRTEQVNVDFIDLQAQVDDEVSDADQLRLMRMRCCGTLGTTATRDNPTRTLVSAAPATQPTPSSSPFVPRLRAAASRRSARWTGCSPSGTMNSRAPLRCRTASRRSRSWAASAWRLTRVCYRTKWSPVQSSRLMRFDSYIHTYFAFPYLFGRVVVFGVWVQTSPPRYDDLRRAPRRVDSFRSRALRAPEAAAGPETASSPISRRELDIMSVRPARPRVAR